MLDNKAESVKAICNSKTPDEFYNTVNLICKHAEFAYDIAMSAVVGLFINGNRVMYRW